MTEVSSKNLTDRLFNTAYYLTNNYHDAQDICQETFLLGFKNLNNFRGESTLATYLYQIAINLCRKRYKRDKNAPCSFTDDLPANPMGNPSVRFPMPTETVIKDEQTKMVQSALNDLTPEQKQVIILKDMEGLAYQEISGILNMSMQSVRTNLANAREKLCYMLKALQH